MLQNALHRTSRHQKRTDDRPPTYTGEKMNQSNTHTPPTNTKNNFFISFFGKMFENVRNRSFFGIVF